MAMAAFRPQRCLRLTTSCVWWRNVQRAQFNTKRLTSSTAPQSKEDVQTTSSPNQALLAEMRLRGLVNKITNESGLEQALDSAKLTAYCGMDPTAESLHLGNLMTLMPLIHLYIRGHNVIPLIGGFTCRVGDPSGKTSEREVAPPEVAASNIFKITSQVSTLFENVRRYAVSHGYKQSAFGKLEIMNNDNWWKQFNFLHFLTRIARHMRLGPMLARDSVKTRLQSPEGIDVASFLYQSLQAFDFLHLHQTKQCRLQVGGSDQWGNIVAGKDLCQKMASIDLDASPGSQDTNAVEVYGLTVPLLLSPSGEKFGKSAGNALFLDPALTHPFDLYQFFLRTVDHHAEQYLRIFTLLPVKRIREILEEHVKAPEKRYAQRILAEEVVTFVHRPDIAQKCMFQTAALYPAPNLTGDSGHNQSALNANTVLQAFQGDDLILKRVAMSSIQGMPISRLLKMIGLVKSSSEGFRAMHNGGVYINGVQRKQVDAVVDKEVLLDGKVIVIRHGRSKFRIVEVLTDAEEEYHGSLRLA